MALQSPSKGQRTAGTEIRAPAASAVSQDVGHLGCRALFTPSWTRPSCQVRSQTRQSAEDQGARGLPLGCAVSWGHKALPGASQRCSLDESPGRPSPCREHGAGSAREERLVQRPWGSHAQGTRRRPGRGSQPAAQRHSLTRHTQSGPWSREPGPPSGSLPSSRRQCFPSSSYHTDFNVAHTAELWSPKWGCRATPGNLVAMQILRLTQMGGAGPTASAVAYPPGTHTPEDHLESRQETGVPFSQLRQSSNTITHHHALVTACLPTRSVQPDGIAGTPLRGKDLPFSLSAGWWEPPCPLAPRLPPPCKPTLARAQRWRLRQDRPSAPRASEEILGCLGLPGATPGARATFPNVGVHAGHGAHVSPALGPGHSVGVLTQGPRPVTQLAKLPNLSACPAWSQENRAPSPGPQEECHLATPCWQVRVGPDFPSAEGARWTE